MNHKMTTRFGLFLAGTVFLFFSLNAFWLLNDPRNPSNSGSLSSTLAAGVRGGIVDASSELLLSASESFHFMNEIELAEVRGLDFPVAQGEVEAALDHLQRAYWAMEWVVRRAEITGVETSRADRLRAFDYQQLTKRFNLNHEIMARVTAYLSQGDVLGLYRQHLANMQSIKETLLYIREELVANRRPANHRMWSLLHLYNDSTLSANYASLVFYQE